MTLPRWLCPRAAAEPAKPEISPMGENRPLAEMTDADLERELHRAIFTLNLCVRAALARDMHVNVVVTEQRDALHPAGRPVVHAEIVRRVVGI